MDSLLEKETRRVASLGASAGERVVQKRGSGFRICLKPQRGSSHIVWCLRDAAGRVA